MAARTASPVFIGRARELELARTALDLTVQGLPSHLLVAGEAGVGKSRFVAQVAEMAHDRGFRAVQAGCVAIGQAGLPYGPIAEILRALSRELEPVELQRAVGDSGRDLSRLAPALNAALISEPAAARDEWAQARLFDAIEGFFRRLAADRPLLLVIEDLHWADPATRDAITFLIPALRSERVMFVLTLRSDELHRRHPAMPWLVEIERSERVRRIDLPRFDDLETVAFLAALGASTQAPGLAARIHRRSDGNAFFIEELVMAGAARGDGAKLPPTLREVLLSRISAASDATQRVLRIAAVAGRRVDHVLLEGVAGLPDDDLDEALRNAVSSHLLVSENDGGAAGYAFRHALLQEAVYDEVLPGERRRLHRAFAEALTVRMQDRGAPNAASWAEVAHHWAAARDETRAAVASIRAGDAAMASFAFGSAHAEYERAIDLWESLSDPVSVLGFDRIELLDRAARAAALEGDFARAVVLQKESAALARSTGDRTRDALAHERLGRTHWLAGDTEASLAAYTDAVALLETAGPSVARARVLAGMGQILMLIDRYEESVSLCSQAIEIARQVGARDVEGHALNSMGTSLAALGDCEAGIRSLREALAIAGDLRIADDVGRAYVNLVDAFRACGRDREGAELAEVGTHRAEELGLQSSYRHFIGLGAALIAYELGRWADAARLAADADRFRPSGRSPDLYRLAYTIGLTVATAEPAVTEGHLARLVELLEGQPTEAQFAGQYAVAAGEFAIWTGRPEAARPIVDEELRKLTDGSAVYFETRLHGIGARAEADLAVRARARKAAGDEEVALAAVRRHEQEIRDLLEKFAPDAGQRAETGVALLTAEAEVGRAAGASDPAQWHAVAERWDALERPYHAAYSRWREAEAYLEHGNRAAGSAALVRAARIAGDLGARHLVEAVEALARRARIELSEAVTAEHRAEATAATSATAHALDPFGLTARERDVLALIADGRTNRQIAEALFISVNTAGVHVSRILGKLHVSRRTEAANIAVRLGIPGSPESRH